VATAEAMAEVTTAVAIMVAVITLATIMAGTIIMEVFIPDMPLAHMD
jgi:hypothetical protein